MINSKQRAYLKSLANNIDTIFQVGKGGVPDTLVVQVNEALNARELIKLKVLDNSLYSAKEASVEIAEKTGAELVQVIGNKFVLYKANPKEPVIKFK